jgi:hypothetical protein
MTVRSSWYASELRRELGLRNQRWAQGRPHVESYGSPPVIVYAPEHPTYENLSAETPLGSKRHGNFFDAAYAAISSRPEWLRRFDKIHAQGRALPRAESGRRWRELDSSMSSDALLMNVFCTPGVAESLALRRALGVDGDQPPIFGWKARVPLKSGRFDRTEVDMRLGSLLVEAKLTENDFQTKTASVVEAYRDFDEVFDRELLPRVQLASKRRREVAEFPENYSQELEAIEDSEEICERNSSAHETCADPAGFDARKIANVEDLVFAPSSCWLEHPAEANSAAGGEAYAGYQLIRNVLAAYAQGCSFCVVHDERRPDLRQAWFEVLAAVKSAEMRVRLKVLTWQELAAMLPEDLQDFLDRKYGIVAPGKRSSLIKEIAEFE